MPAGQLRLPVWEPRGRTNLYRQSVTIRAAWQALLASPKSTCIWCLHWSGRPCGPQGRGQRDQTHDHRNGSGPRSKSLALSRLLLRSTARLPTRECHVRHRSHRIHRIFRKSGRPGHSRAQITPASWKTHWGSGRERADRWRPCLGSHNAGEFETSPGTATALSPARHPRSMPTAAQHDCRFRNPFRRDKKMPGDGRCRRAVSRHPVQERDCSMARRTTSPGKDPVPALARASRVPSSRSWRW